MTDATHDYGDFEVAKVSLEKIFNNVDLTDEEIEILTLRFGYRWYYYEIAEHVGLKYRGKEYNEGTVRYKVRIALKKIKLYLKHSKSD